MTNALTLLYSHQDKAYAEFQAKLTPTVPTESFIGVRVPDVRTIAKVYKSDPESKEFIRTLPHKYYDENMLHGLLLSDMKDYDECIVEVDNFLPYVDNWAVCDIMSPKCFKKHKKELFAKLPEWINSDKTYTCRFGIEMLMSHFLDDDFSPAVLELPAKVESTEYYVNMMLAWFYATALAKQWEATLPYIKEHRFGEWVHKKIIQKACESYRITEEEKALLKSFR